MEVQKLKLNLEFTNLIVEVYNGNHLVPEVCIYLENDKDMQDIAIIRQATNDNYEKQNAVECLVYSDKDSEDYTHKFIIKEYDLRN